MIYRFASFEYDQKKAELRRAGKVVPLEPQVFTLLGFLIEHRDRVVHRQELIETVWGGRIISESVVSSRVKAARKALGDDGKTQAFIKTIHGTGFRFVHEVDEGASSASPPPTGARKESAVTIVVLPFRLISTDPSHTVLAETVHADLTTQLARVRDFSVISRKTSALYADKPVSASDLSRLLGVSYIIEGTLRPSGHLIRLSAQIIDGSTGACVAALEFDRPTDELLDLQNTVITEIVNHLGAEINFAEVRRLEQRAGADPTAVDHVKWAWVTVEQEGWNTVGLNKAVGRLKQAIEIDPNYAPAIASLALFNGIGVRFYILKDETGQIRRQVVETAARAVELDAYSSDVLGYAGCALCDVGEIDLGIQHLLRAIKIDPSNGQAHAALGWGRFLQGRFDEGLQLMSEAIRISPTYPGQAFWLFGLANGYLLHGELDKAEGILKDALMIDPQFNGAYRMLAEIEKRRGNSSAAAAYNEKAQAIEGSKSDALREAS